MMKVLSASRPFGRRSSTATSLAPRLARVGQRGNERTRRAQQTRIAPGRTDELHADGKLALAREQRQRQRWQTGQCPQSAEDGIAGGIEPFRGDAGCGRRDNGVVDDKNVREGRGVTRRRGERARDLQAKRDAMITRLSASALRRPAAATAIRGRCA
jgi:hypothetical protein